MTDEHRLQHEGGAERPRHFDLWEGVAAGTVIGWLAAIGEVVLRVIYPGGLGPEALIPPMLLIVGTYSGMGAASGAASALLLSLVPPGTRGRATASRSALLTLAGVVVVALSLWAEARYSLPLRSPATLAAIAGAGGGFCLFIWLARAPLEGLVAAALRSRKLILLLAPLAAIPLACAIPWLLLGENLGAVRGIIWRGGSLFAGLVVGGIVFFSLLLLSVRKDQTRPRIRKWVLYYTLSATLVSLAAGIWSNARGRPAGRPNILLIVIDTLRADHLSTYGYGRDTTPEITALAARGTLFRDAVSPAPFTMPAMASLMTSRLPYEHGVRYHASALRHEEVTLAEVLRQNRYVTGAVVSNMLLARRWGFDQGFDRYDAIRESPLGVAGDLFLFRLLRKLQRGPGAGETAGSAIRWIERHKGDPFFLWVHFIDPHFPYEPPPPYDRLFSRRSADRYAALLRSYRTGGLAMSQIALGGALPESTLAEGMAQYDGEIAYADREVGTILAAIDELGLTDKTLVVITSDHGEALGEHGVSFAHDFNTYEELMHVPLVMAGPAKIPRGTEIRTQVRLLDLAPTLLDFVGLPAPPSMRGRSLLPLVAGEGATGELPPAYGENAPLLPGHPSYSVISKYPEMYRSGLEGKWRMVRSPPWKLIHIPGRPDGEDLLFNLELDPKEQEDRAGSYPKELGSLLDHLETHLAQERSSPAAAPLELSSDEIEKLRALGYAD